VDLRVSKYSVSWPRPFGRSVDRETLRSRVLAFTGIWFLLAGLLAAVGFSAILVASFLLLLVAGVVAGGRRLLRRDGVERRGRMVLASIEHWIVEHSPQRHVQRLAGAAYRTVEARPRERAEVDRHRQALRLNELGAQLRRDGDREQAAVQHRAALAIVRELGDRRAEALTLNNLALALVHTGSVAIAVQHFEQALVLFRELGDDEHEGQVIANLGSVRRRQGRDEDAESLLNAALHKLPPGSYAYRQVEEQLRRAS
jgi:tetratricopeptide (TPR) repeat protein